MRYLILACSALALSAAPALAVENFIPLGQNYSIGENEVPPIGSEQDKINAQLDIYQTEIYGRDLREKQFDTRLNYFQPEQNRAIDGFLDY